MLCLLTASLAFAPHAMAQEAPAATGAQAQPLEEVTVTGTRIKRKDLESQSPLVTIDSEQLEQRSGLNLESYLNTLPNYNPAQTPTTENEDVQPSATNTVGISTISLRGLGPNRGLVLIDGHRTTPVNELMVTDINTIPSAMVDRVEIISGGASAVYGADALAGVTNFILKKNFTGAQLDIQDGITQAGDGNETRVTGMIGTTIGDGKGNLIMGTEYYNRDAAYQKNRSFFTNSWNDPNSGGGNAFGLGLGGPNEEETTFDYPSAAALAAVFPARTAAGISVCPASGCFFQSFLFNSNQSLFLNNGPMATNNYQGSTNSNGYGVENGYYGTVTNTTLNGGQPPLIDQTLKWNNPLATISEPQTRYSFFANGTYDITDKVQFYANARFADSLTTTLLDVGTTATFGWEASVPFNATTDSPINPALVNPGTSQANLTTIYNAFAGGTQATTSIGGVPIVNPGFIGTGTSGAQHPVPWQLAELLMTRSVFGVGIPLGTFPGFASTEQGGPITCGTSYSVTSGGKLLTSPCSPAPTSWILGYEPGVGDAAPRSTVDDATQWQIETGFKFPLYISDWTGDIYYSRGQSQDIDYGYGNDSLDRWRAVIDAPDYGNGDTFQGNAVGASTNFGNSVPTQCSGGYYSAIFTGGPASASCQNAISATLPAETLMQQDIVEANFQGTLFKLPAGDVSGAVGYQYRRDAGQYIAAGLQSTNSFTDTAIGLYPQGSNNVEIASRDGYAELFIPLVQDLKLLKSWNLDIGGRYSTFDFGPTATTFKVNTDAQLTKSLRIRGGFNRATRAPNLGELYLPQQEFFTLGGAIFGDPCSLRSKAPFGAGGAAPDQTTGSAGPTTLAPGQTAAGAQSTYLICQAQMSTGAAQYYGPTGNQSGDAAAGGFTWENQEGNPNLQSETANTWTAGFVWSNLSDSPWLRGLTGSVDWWQIHIQNAIELYSPDYANYLCYGTTTVTTAAQAAAQAASPACQNVPRSVGTGGQTTLNLQYSNLATIGEAGVDMQINWFAQFADLGLSAIPGGLAFNTQDTLLQYFKTKQSPLSFDVNTNWKDSSGPVLADTNGGAYGYRLTASISYVLPTVSVNLRWRFLPSLNSFTRASNEALIAYDAKVAASGGKGFLDYTPDDTIAAPAWNAFDLSFNWNINKTLSIRGGINNLLDKSPAITGATTGFPTAAAVASSCSSATLAQGCVAPTAYSLASDGAGTTNAGFYDVYGRTFFLGAKATF
jgi:iron complex outermembrane receptor protein